MSQPGISPGARAEKTPGFEMHRCLAIHSRRSRNHPCKFRETRQKGEWDPCFEDELTLGLLICLASSLQGQLPTVSDALAAALKGTQASAVVVDQSTGRMLAQTGRPLWSLPGSAIKPLLLEYALKHGIVRTDTEVYCRRHLHIAGRALPCTHPAGQPVFTAERALARRPQGAVGDWTSRDAVRDAGLFTTLILSVITGIQL